MEYHIYAGAYTEENGEGGITHLLLDTEKQTMVCKSTCSEAGESPSFLAVTEKHLYAVSEQAEKGAVSSFDRDPDTGELRLLNRIDTEGTLMCHLCVWPGERYLSAANYGSGSLMVCPVSEKGAGQPVAFIQHHGVGYASETRQEGPHVHATGLSSDGTYLYASDLGLDQVFCYRIGKGGELQCAEEEEQIHTPDGTGPRHFVFSGDGQFLYLVTEMGNRLFVCKKQDSGSRYRIIQEAGTLPADYREMNLAADIHLSKDGKFLYISNRGADNVAVFSISDQTGFAELVGFCECGGEFPRHFCLTPDDRFVLVANQKSGNVALYERNTETGLLGEKLDDVRIPQVSCVCVIL